MDGLSKPEVLLVFTYAPAGLGHLRVMDALYDGLPKYVNAVVMGAEDERIIFWHRITSLSPFIREAMEWVQARKYGYLFYDFYVGLLLLTTEQLYGKMKEMITTQWQEKKTVVIVSTHFGLAHQLAHIKTRLEKDLGIKIILVVQVTDATSIEIWYVPGADMTCVPSLKVKNELEAYAKRRGLKKTRIEVLPYPLSQTLAQKLNDIEYAQRLEQYDGSLKCDIKVAIPVSGAAVGMTYFERLAEELHKKSKRYRITIVTKNNSYTRGFINKMKRRSYIEMIDDPIDKKVVDAYEELYGSEIMGLEVVKPSEQAFKSLFTPDQRGGAVLLLAQAIGKQEHDNLNFLLDHKLIPAKEDQIKMEGYALSNQLPEMKDCQDCAKRAKDWKGIQLTNNPEDDAKIIDWCVKAGVFKQMSQPRDPNEQEDRELASDGVEKFWGKVNEIVADKITSI